MTDTVLFRLDVAPARRVVALAFLIALAVILILTALMSDMSFGFRAAALGFGLGAAWAGRAMARGTRHAVELRDDGVYLSNGTVLARLDDIEQVDRGMFALKPSNGFALKLRHAPGFAFCPGLYWQVGRTLGIGGVTSRGAGKAFADGLTMHLAVVRGDVDLK